VHIQTDETSSLSPWPAPPMRLWAAAR
jgi:hypothetical protein